MSDSLITNIFPPINFAEIPSNLQVPGNYTEIGADYSNIGLLTFPAKALIIGPQQNTASQTGAPGNIYQIKRIDLAVNLFGASSPLAQAIDTFLAANTGIPVDAIGLMKATGAAAAAGSITFGGAATVVGPQAFGVAGNRVVFTISPGDAPATMATNFIAAAEAIANAPNWPVAFATSGTAGQVTITANLVGAAGNEYDIRINPADRDTTVPGVTAAIVDMAGGTLVPDLAAALSAIATDWYTDIIVCMSDEVTLGELTPVLAERYGPIQPLDSQAYVGFSGTQGQIASGVANAGDSQYLCFIGVKNPQQPSWVWAAALGAAAARALLDDPARQLRTLPLAGIIAPARADRFFYPQQSALIPDGVTTWDVAPDGSVILQRAVTTYTQSSLGVPDTAWQDIMTAKVLTRIRWDWNNYLKLVWPRAKLADDGTLAAEYDPKIATPKRLKASWAARCQLYERAGWIENSAVTAAASVFVRDANNRNQVDSQLQIKIIGNLMINAQQLLFAAGE